MFKRIEENEVKVQRFPKEPLRQSAGELEQEGHIYPPSKT
jgi:hypothetical protein